MGRGPVEVEVPAALAGETGGNEEGHAGHQLEVVPERGIIEGHISAALNEA